MRQYKYEGTREEREKCAYTQVGHLSSSCSKEILRQFWGKKAVKKMLENQPLIKKPTFTCYMCLLFLCTWSKSQLVGSLTDQWGLTTCVKNCLRIWGRYKSWSAKIKTWTWFGKKLNRATKIERPFLVCKDFEHTVAFCSIFSCELIGML